jgi:Na+-translocating ferredoxin:NAD+ oxidoreductase RnfE subunit
VKYEELKKSLLLTAPAPLFGIGLVVPLLTGGSLQQNAVLGLAATVSLVFVNIVVAFGGERAPANMRTAFATLIACGVLAIVKTCAASLMPLWNVPLETLAPLLILAAVIASDTGAYAIKKKRFVPVFFDGFGIGIIFTVALCGLGALCVLAGTGGHCSFISFAAGAFFALALCLWGAVGLKSIIRRRKGAVE